MPKQYLPEFKKQVVLSIQNGLSVCEASQRYKVSLNTLYRWKKDFEPAGNLLSMNDYITTQRQSNRFEHILQIIRLSAIIENVPLQKRLEILARLHEQFEQYSVHELCEALDVSRGTFYNHIFRKVDRAKRRTLWTEKNAGFMRNPVSKKETLINFFFPIFAFFQESRIYYQNQKSSNTKALQTEKVPLFDKIVRKATPLQLVRVKL